MASAIPAGYHTITPVLILKDTRKAIDFYKQAFGAVERVAMPGPGGKGVMHAEVQVGNSMMMMGDESPQHPCKSAETLGNSPIQFYLYVEDVDAAFQKAVAAGATIQCPVIDMFWGDRMGTVKDPFGYSWTLATHVRDVTPEELAQAAQAAMAKMKKQ